MRSFDAATAKFAEGRFHDVSLEITPRVAGDFVACVYLVENWTKTTAAAAAFPVSVRMPASSLQLSLPAPRFPDGASVPLSVTAFAEVESDLTIEVNRFGVRCGPSVSANAGTMDWIRYDEIAGGPNTSAVSAATAGSPFGSRPRPASRKP